MNKAHLAVQDLLDQQDPLVLLDKEEKLDPVENLELLVLLDKEVNKVP